MLLENGAMIKQDVINSFETAVANPENINTDNTINWNFVDADLYGSDHRPNDDAEYMTLFDSLAIQYDLANGVIA